MKFDLQDVANKNAAKVLHHLRDSLRLKLISLLSNRKDLNVIEVTKRVFLDITTTQNHANGSIVIKNQIGERLEFGTRFQRATTWIEETIREEEGNLIDDLRTQ